MKHLYKVGKMNFNGYWAGNSVFITGAEEDIVKFAKDFAETNCRFHCDDCLANLRKCETIEDLNDIKKVVGLGFEHINVVTV